MSPELSNQIDAWVKSGQVTEAAAQAARVRIESRDSIPTNCFPQKGGIRCEWTYSGVIHIIEVHADGVRVYEDEREMD